MRILVILITCIITARSSFSYPIPPRPLRKLITESEFIISGKVIKTGQVTKKGKSAIWESNYALILVETLLQGKTVPDTVKVYYSGGMICPAPPVYNAGEMVIVFLDQNPDDKKSYYTHALSYGAKSFTSEEDRNVYKTRILEMQDILAIKNPSKKHDGIIDWLVKCAAHPATRWDGVYELSPQSDFMSHYDNDKTIKKSVFLNTAQKQLLFTSFMNIEIPTHYDLFMVDIISGVNDASVLDQLKTRLKSIEPGNDWLSSLIMVYIVRLTGNKELEALQEQFQETLYNPSKNNKPSSIQLYKDFLRKMENIPVKQDYSTAGIHAG